MGAGRRSCPAIQFSSVIIELALANVVQKFDRKLSTSAEDLDMACVKDLLLNSIAVPHRSSACKGLHTLGVQIIWRPWLLLWCPVGAAALSINPGFCFKVDYLKVVILLQQDMFTAGTDTTHTTLEWAMAELTRHPRVIDKSQTEGRGIVASKTDREDDLVEMQYSKAVMKETLQLHPPVPLLISRLSTGDVKIHGCNIKANTQEILSVLKTEHRKYPLEAVVVPYKIPSF